MFIEKAFIEFQTELSDAIRFELEVSFFLFDENTIPVNAITNVNYCIENYKLTV